jgi:hypothetical protein
MLKVDSEVNAVIIILKKACAIKILNKTKKIDCNSLSIQSFVLIWLSLAYFRYKFNLRFVFLIGIM